MKIMNACEWLVVTFTKFEGDPLDTKKVYVDGIGGGFHVIE